MAKRIVVMVFDDSNTADEELFRSFDLSDEQLAQASAFYGEEVSPMLAARAALHYYDILTSGNSS